MRKRLTILTLPAIILLVTGCNMLPIPKEQRYTEIYKFLEKIDYKSTGEVVEEAKDNGDGVFAASSVVVIIHGSNSYDSILKNSKKAFPEFHCSRETIRKNDCAVNGIEVVISRFSDNTQNVTLRVSDDTSGRERKI